MYNNHEYLIIFKSYNCDDETINFDTMKIFKSTSDIYPTIYANLDNLMQLVH